MGFGQQATPPNERAMTHYLVNRTDRRTPTFRSLHDVCLYVGDLGEVPQARLHYAARVAGSVQCICTQKRAGQVCS